MEGKIICVSSVLFLVGCGSGVVMMEDEQEIRLIREASNRAIAAHDTAALARTLTVDYHIISSRNSESSGRVATCDRLAAEATAKPDVIYVRTSEDIQIYSDWKMAGESGSWIGRWTEGTDKIELTGTYFAKWHKVDDRWLIRAEVFVPLSCNGGSYCDQGPI